jgi:hypothetical protein
VDTQRGAHAQVVELLCVCTGVHTRQHFTAPPPPQFVAVKVLRSERVGPRDYVRAAHVNARQARQPALVIVVVCPAHTYHAAAGPPLARPANLTHRRTIPRR